MTPEDLAIIAIGFQRFISFRVGNVSTKQQTLGDVKSNEAVTTARVYRTDFVVGLMTVEFFNRTTSFFRSRPERTIPTPIKEVRRESMDGRETARIVGLSFAGLYMLMMVLAAMGMA
jgi:hypothetical protein